MLILKKVKGNYIGRPRVINVEGGEIQLCNFSKERADQIEAFIANLDNKEQTLTDQIYAQQLQPEVEKTKPDFKNKAVGKHYNNETKVYEIAVISYDPVNRLATVDEVKNAGDFNNQAIGVFKNEIFKLKLL